MHFIIICYLFLLRLLRAIILYICFANYNAVHNKGLLDGLENWKRSQELSLLHADNIETLICNISY